jgi:hypothetical protein
MLPNQIPANPFVLLMNPESVIQAIERSERLSGLASRICRPLDKPLIPRAAGETSDADEFDRSLDSSVDPFDR